MKYIFPSNSVLFLPNSAFSLNILGSIWMVSLNFNYQKHLKLIDFIYIYCIYKKLYYGIFFRNTVLCIYIFLVNKFW